MNFTLVNIDRFIKVMKAQPKKICASKKGVRNLYWNFWWIPFPRWIAISILAARPESSFKWFKAIMVHNPLG